MPPLIEPIPTGQPSFLDAPRADDLATLDADVAILGVPYGVPYDMVGETSPSAPAPGAVRAQSVPFAPYLHHYDFEAEGEVFGGRAVRIVDCGNVAMMPGQFAANSAATTAAVAAILERGAVPIILGGDHAIPIPVMRAYEGHGSMVVVQFDAHLDFRDELNGVREGLSSPMRRASEMSWVARMAQIGLRGVGSGRREEFDAARAYGSVMIGAEEVHQQGVEAALARVPAAERYYITFDVDGLDPAIAPAVGAPAFGGLTYFEATRLLQGIARKGKVVGFDINEIVPSLDVRDLTSRLAARLTLNLIGALVREGQAGRP